MSPLGGFDQVVAITQWKINHDLNYRYETWKRPLQRFIAHSGDENDGFMEAILSPPTVELYVPGEPQKAVFRLNFTDGYFDYPQGEDHTLQRLPMKGWSLAFLANLSPSNLTQVPSEIKSDIPDHVVDQIENAGSYSLSQVLIDLGTANVVNFDFSRSVTPGLVASDASDAPKKQALETFIKAHLEELAEGGHNVLGYAITVRDPVTTGETLPSLAPVSVSVQVMPCIEGPGASVGTRDRDALLFLEMVGSMAGRSHPPVPLAGSDAWVPQGEVGTMVVHKNAFWERFLVKEFTFFIRDAIRLTNTIGNWVQSKDLKGDLLQETAWILTEPQNCPNDDSWSTTSDHSANFNWKGYKKVKISEHNCWTGSFNETKELNSDISVVAEIVPGTHFITVKTHIKYQYYDHHDDYPVGEHDPHPWTESTNAEIEWETKLAFNSVAGGTLGTEVTVGTPKCQCKVDDTTHGIFEMIFGGTRPDRVMTDKVQKYLEDNVKGDQIAALVDQGLTTHSHFVFSGAGAFTMKTPRFTSDHDLQVYLEPKMGRENQRE